MVDHVERVLDKISAGETLTDGEEALALALMQCELEQMMKKPMRQKPVLQLVK